MAKGIATGGVNLVKPPTSTQIITGAYTVPAGYYAHVKCLEAHDADMTVDGVVVEQKRNIVFSVNTTSWAGGFQFSFPSGYTWKVSGTLNGYNPFGSAYTYAFQINVVSWNADYAKMPMMANTSSLSNQVFERLSIDVGASAPIPVMFKDFKVNGGDTLYWVASHNSHANAGRYSYYILGQLEKEGDNYQDIVPENTDLDGDRYSVTLYAN